MTTANIFRFATFTDFLLIVIGSLFAVIEGAGPALMALVFGGMTNTLVTTVRFGFAKPASNGTSGVTTNTTSTGIMPASGATTNMTSSASSMIESAAIGDGGDLLPPPNQMTPEEFESSLAVFSILYVLIGVSVYVSSLIQITCWQTACERQVHRIRLAFFRSVLRQELAWFDKNQSGELAVKFNDDIERIRDGLGEQFSLIIKYSASFVTGFMVGFIVSWRLTLVIMVATPLLALFSAYLGKMLATSSQREQEKYAAAGALAEEVLTSIRTVLSLGGQHNEIKRYTKKLNESKKMAQKKYWRLSLVFAASLFVLYATYGLALYVATDLLSVALITPGAAMSVIMAVMMGASALGNMIPPFQTVVVAGSSSAVIYDIIDSVPRIDALSDRGLKLTKVTANIKFEKVTFAYPLRDVPVLRNLSFELSQGQTVAFCGRTGSGKSTIMNLLLRFYDPQDGCVYLDNCNLRDLNVAWLRSLIGIVEQEPALFNCSIYENIVLGSAQESDKSYQRVVEAAKLANAHEFIINLPDGYNTRCGDRGVQMSGGQKQRISIARALLCDPKILLLDEATSALDSESESMVQLALNKARQGRTTIIIAHRLSTIRDADMICVMENGAIVESGRHDELMAKRNEYFNLVTNQVFTDEDSPNRQRSSPSQSDADDDDDDLRQQQLQRRSTAGLDSDFEDNDQLLPARRKERSVSVASRHRSLESPGARKETSGLLSKKTSANLYDSINRPIKSMIEFQNSQMDQQVELPTLKDILRLIKPELSNYVLAVVAIIASGALLPTFALFYAQIFETFTKTGDELLDSGSFWALMFVALAAANFIAMFFRILLMSNTIEVTLARLRSECFASILRQHVGWFDRIENSPQRLTARLASDVPQIKAVLNSRLSTFIAGFATIASALFIAFYLGWQLAILLTIALPILLYVGYLQMRISRGDRSQHVKRMENASRLATEVIEHIKLVQSINQERYFFDRFYGELKGPLKESLASAKRFGLIYGLSQSVIYFVYGASFRWGAYLMAREILDPITVYRIFFSIAFTAVAVGQWGGLSSDMSRANYAIGMIIKLLNTRPAIDNLSRGGFKPQRNDLKGAVSFQDVHFRYPTRPDTQVLQGLNLDIEAGKTLALVGPSGMGKSTIAALLLRFYDPDRGVVRIDGHDVRCINLNHLRMNVGLVSQEPVLFRASIRDNIVYGLDPARYSMREIRMAAKLANIDEFIESLPDKYNTLVGDRGSQLSGGQKQRIAIARTLIRNPTILVLDEATSALDAESEALVSQALDKAAKGKTCIKIAHRLSTVRDADKIAVIERGRVVEQGTHDELMSIGQRGVYFKLMQKQEFA
jgi:ATP-binding cassette subfamily B (MDR/TAP) protein 1